jgi:lysylphosphatidylglycerol synthetase-like protein (DUF2156 family)
MVKSKNITKAKRTESSKKMPVGVQIISVLHYIFAVLLALLGLFFIILSGLIVSAVNSPEANIDPSIAAVITPGLIIGMGVFLIIVGVLIFFLGRGLWKLKEWARITSIILSALLVVYEVYSMIVSFAIIQTIWILIFLAIGAYLTFSKEAKAAFK